MAYLIRSIAWTLLLILANRADAILDPATGKGLLNGINFRVSGFEFPPFFSSKRTSNGTLTYTGVGAEMVELMADYFKFRIVYVPVDPSEWAKGGAVYSLFRQLNHNEIDYAPFPFQLILESASSVDFSFPFSVEIYILMQPYPQEKSRVRSLADPFSRLVWLLFFLSTFIIIVMLALLRTLATRGKATGPITGPSFFESFYPGTHYVLSIITSQGSSVPQSASFAWKSMAGLWLLAMVVISYAYTGTLTALFTIPRLEPTVDTLEELAATRKFRLTMEKGSEISYKALNATSGPYKIFGDDFRQDPDLLFVDAFQVLTNVVQRNCAYAGAVSIVNYYIAADRRAHGKCRLTSASKELEYQTTIVNALQKNSRYTEIISHRFIMYLWENGYTAHSKKKNFPAVPECRADLQSRIKFAASAKKQAFKLVELTGVFLLFGFGASLSFSVFILEMVVAFWLSRSRNC